MDFRKKIENMKKKLEKKGEDALKRAQKAIDDIEKAEDTAPSGLSDNKERASEEYFGEQFEPEDGKILDDLFGKVNNDSKGQSKMSLWDEMKNGAKAIKDEISKAKADLGKNLKDIQDIRQTFEGIFKSTFGEDTEFVMKNFDKFKNLNNQEELQNEILKEVEDIIEKTNHPSVVDTKDNPEDPYSYFLEKKAKLENDEDKIVRNMVENILSDLDIPYATVRYVTFPGDDLSDEWAERVDGVFATAEARMDNRIERIFLEHEANVIGDELIGSVMAVETARDNQDDAIFNALDDVDVNFKVQDVSDRVLDENDQEYADLKYPEKVEYHGNTIITSHVDEVLNKMGVRPTLRVLMKAASFFMDESDMAKSEPRNKGPQPQ